MVFGVPILPFLRGSKEKRERQGERQVAQEQVAPEVVEETKRGLPTPTLIAFSSTKGGCGKSLLATGSAIIASATGEKVMVVDLDITNMTATMIIMGSLGMKSENLYRKIYKELTEIRMSVTTLLKESLALVKEIDRASISITSTIGGPLVVRREVHGIFIPEPGKEKQGSPMAYVGDIYFIPAAQLSLAAFERDRFYETPADEINDQVAALTRVLRKIASEVKISRIFIDLPPTDRLRESKASYKWIQIAAEKSDIIFLVTEYISTISGETPPELIGFMISFKGMDKIVSKGGGVIVNKVDPSIVHEVFQSPEGKKNEIISKNPFFRTLSTGFPDTFRNGRIYLVPRDPVWEGYKYLTSRHIHPILFSFRGAGAALAAILLSEGIIDKFPGQ
jgi:hypothetical protein